MTTYHDLRALLVEDVSIMCKEPDCKLRRGHPTKHYNPGGDVVGFVKHDGESLPVLSGAAVWDGFQHYKADDYVERGDRA